MTIVVYRARQMACDSSVVHGGTRIHSIKKIWRVGNGLVGGAGTIGDLIRFVEWLRDGAIESEFTAGDYHAITVDPSGKLRAWEGIYPDPLDISDEYCAVGAGRDHALGAMFAGADARTAVRAAIRYDQSCAPPIRVYKLRDR